VGRKASGPATWMGSGVAMKKAICQVHSFKKSLGFFCLNCELHYKIGPTGWRERVDNSIQNSSGQLAGKNSEQEK